jgi:acetyltransferase-like isoleucine patch superfamily enzyme
MSAARRLKTKIIASVYGTERAARDLGVSVGDGCRILSLEFGSEPWLISIGDRVTISGGVQFLTHDGSGWLYRDGKGRRFRYRPISIGNDVFVGNRSILMPGVAVGDRSVIGAGSVVTRSVVSGSVVAGNPARPITTFEDLMNRIVDWPSESDLTGLSYRERVRRATFASDVPPQEAAETASPVRHGQSEAAARLDPREREE